MPVYLLRRLFQAIADTVKHWYVGGFEFFYKTAFVILKKADRVFSVRVNAENIFRPLYQDRSFLGYFFGFFMRIFKIALGAVVHAAVLVFTIFVYILWSFTPVYLILKTIGIDA